MRSASAGSATCKLTEKPAFGCECPGGASDPISIWLPTASSACITLSCQLAGTCSAAGVPACGISVLIVPPRTLAYNSNASLQRPSNVRYVFNVILIPHCGVKVYVEKLIAADKRRCTDRKSVV